MIMAKGSDCRKSAFSVASKISVTAVEVTDSARELEQSHLCGPTAALVQAEALAGVALLGAEMVQADETISLRLRVSGPLGGVLVENAADGSLRGYTHTKVMNDLDEAEELDTSVALGDLAEVQVIRSTSGKILSSASIDIHPASVSAAVEAFYRQSLQRQVAIQTHAQSYGEFIEAARGVMVECLPDGDQAVFSRIRALFEDMTVLECLESAASLETVCETLGLTDCYFFDPKPLRFGCRCSTERIQGMLAGLPTADLSEMAAKNEPLQIYCHMCGKGYRIEHAFIQDVLNTRASNKA